MQKGIATIILVIVLGLVVAGGFILLQNVVSKSQERNITPSPIDTPTPSPSPTEEATPSGTVAPVSAKPKPVVTATPVPLITCVGPDGKVLELSRADCNNFLKAWATSSPTPTPTPAPNPNCSYYDLTAGYGNLNVTLVAQTGQTLSANASITIDDQYTGCVGASPNWPSTQTIDTSSNPTVSFGSMRPGPRVVTTSYHGHTYTNNVQINSGNNSLTVTVDE